MGKSSKIKQRKAEADEEAFKQRFAQLSRQAASTPQEIPLIEEFTGYHDKFVRKPETFVLRTRSAHRSKQALEMARHLFGRFRVPRILEQVWTAYMPDHPRDRQVLPMRRNGQAPVRGPVALGNPNLRTINFRDWFVCVATGGSLYKEHAKAWLTKKETHTFLCANPDLDLCQAVIYAVARCAGANDGGALRLARSKLAQQPFGEFWFSCVRFFCLPDHMPENLAQVNDLVDYVDARHREDAAFRLLGSSQSLAAVLRRMEQWHRALARAKDLVGIQWPGVDLPDYQIEQKDPQNPHLTVVWNFHQITSGKELAAEGTAMRHCVFGYKTRCVDGSCSIWSLTRTDPFGTPVRRLTIEVNRNGTIMQKRGLANRLPRAEEAHMIEKWAAAMNLENRSYNGW